jgi:dolichol-phosphate mannosyltransferase
MISVIFPAYNEAETLEALYARLKDVASKLSTYHFEFIFVDDCSTDQTPEILKKLHAQDGRIKTIRFSRNFGSHTAIACGLRECQGKAAVVMAADLQDPPELISSLIDEWQKGNCLVWGIRLQREGETIATNFLSRLYYQLMNWLTTVKMPPTGADVFLADRKVIEAFKCVTEKHTSVFMTLAWLGFKRGSITYVKQARHAGRTKWSLGKKIKLTIDSLLAFSDVPIRYMSVLGFFIAFLGFLYAGYVFWSFINGSPVEGWSSLMVAILVIGGVQMMMVGVLGEYLWRTFDEARHRPKYVIEYRVGIKAE